MKKILFVAAASMFASALYAQTTDPTPPATDAATAPAPTPTDAAAPAPATDPAAATPTTPSADATPPADTSGSGTADEHKGKHKKKPR